MQRRRVVFATTAAAVAAAVTIAGAPVANAAPAPIPSTAAFCANVGDDLSFPDVTANVADINCLAAAGISVGDGNGNYNPLATVSRGQMALFLQRTAELIVELDSDDDALTPAALNPAPPSAFTDAAGVSELAINQLADADIALGTTATTFSPEAGVTRGPMASFINRLQGFVTGSPFGGPDTNFIDADEPHKANINGLASVGIVQGGPGGLPADQYGPALGVTRQQMASFIIRYLAVLEAVDFIDPLPGGGGESLTFGPDTEVSFADNPAGTVGTVLDSGDDQLYTATGLAAGTYRVTLVAEENITNGTFVEDGTTGLALAAPNGGAFITEVNNIAVPPAPSILTAAVDGAVTVLVDAESLGSVIPVIYEAPADPMDANTRLNIDDDGVPTEDFGLAGVFNSFSAEAELGDFVNGTVTATDDATFAEVNGNTTVFFEATDSYRIFDGVFCIATTAANFLEQLSTDDTLATVDDINNPVPGPYTPGGTNTYCLTDSAPLAPSITGTDIDSVDGTVTVGGLATDATVTVYASVNPPGTFAAATQVGQTDTDADPVLAGFQVEVTGLTPDTQYNLFATQTVDGDESDESAATAVATSPTPANITIVSVEVTGDVNNGIGTFSTVLVTYSAAVSPLDPSDFEYFPTAQPAVISTATGVVDGPLTTQVIVTFPAEADSDPDVNYTLTQATGGVLTDPGLDPIQPNTSTFAH